jgi:hypothetical protein
MQVAVWAYPWDLFDIGVDEALSRTTAAGANMLSLATSYHAGRFLQPGNPKRRVYYPEDGTVYYTVDLNRWWGAEIAPQQAAMVEAEGDMLAELVARRDVGGPGVSCWTVCLHNSRLGALHPAHRVRTAFGDGQVYGLCPSSSAARAYVTGMVAEIAERYQPDRIELESPDFMGFSHGYHHEKDGLPLQPEEDFLLGVCFCAHCLARAQAAGVDGVAARNRVQAVLEAAFARELPMRIFPDFPAAGIGAFAGEGALWDYLRWRSEPVTSLVAEARAVARAASGGRTRVMLIDFAGSWWGGVDIAQAAKGVDGVLYCAYVQKADEVAVALAPVRAAMAAGQDLVVGFQLFHPNVADKADLVARVAAAGGVQGLNFYCLGLVPPPRLGWIAAAIAQGVS